MFPYSEREKSRQASPQSLGSDYMHGSPQDPSRFVLLREGGEGGGGTKLGK